MVIAWLALAGIMLEIGLLAGMLITERNLNFVASTNLQRFNERLKDLQVCDHEHED